MFVNFGGICPQNAAEVAVLCRFSKSNRFKAIWEGKLGGMSEILLFFGGLGYRLDFRTSSKLARAAPSGCVRRRARIFERRRWGIEAIALNLSIRAIIAIKRRILVEVEKNE